MHEAAASLRGWVQPMPGAKQPEKMISQCCCLKDIIRAIENDTEPVLNAEHARHILEIMCKIPEVLATEKPAVLKTTF